MYPSLLRRASASAPLPLSLQQASAQLIPPIPLYRRLLRIHRHLTPEMRFMGDSYIKSEFRLTRKTDNPLHIIAFLSQWKVYLDQLQSDLGLGSSSTITSDRRPNIGVLENESDLPTDGQRRGEKVWRGRKLNMDGLEKMSAEQVGQLYELMHATKHVWKSSDQLEEQASNAEATASTKQLDDRSPKKR
ncbi:acetate non-utilizing protein 9, mitochondrial [Tremella mesenterica]|uniref:Succinate dehydrogenase assembly factor 3 n=1 Tax=Tremella mesenterica TaxID=5217 RepID=A0A4V1M4K3_TREME|nr:acetate non-utilizing protein 9, mitochondrial [Tremella mesenterica]